MRTEFSTPEILSEVPQGTSMFDFDFTSEDNSLFEAYGAIESAAGVLYWLQLELLDLSHDHVVPGSLYTAAKELRSQLSDFIVQTNKSGGFRPH